MTRRSECFIQGQWVASATDERVSVIDPAREEPLGEVSRGHADDVEAAVRAAADAFDDFSETPLQERLSLLDRVIDIYERRIDEMAETIGAEMGAPAWLARRAQAPSGLKNLKAARSAGDKLELERAIGQATVFAEPIGVCGLITPWNWPVNQITVKVGPALVAGCTMVLKPSEVAPFSASLFTEILAEAGVPAGVFNMVQGEGPIVGEALARHPDVALVSFTGSTRAGVAVATAAAPTVKRVCQELGGKSANILLESALSDEAAASRAIRHAVRYCFDNSGQSCAAPTRLFVPEARLTDVLEQAAKIAAAIPVGDPAAPPPSLGPVVSETQFNRVQSLIQTGLDEGARLVTGGLGRPEGIDRGYYVRPTIFADVTNDMTIAQEEIFGPVLVVIAYRDVDDAVRMANASKYGLSGYVSGAREEALRVARRMRTGTVHVNAGPIDFDAPFGGYKQSGNGRERGVFGLAEFLEHKAVTARAS